VCPWRDRARLHAQLVSPGTNRDHRARLRRLSCARRQTWTGIRGSGTLEDRNVAYLRRHDKPRKVARDKATRAEFVRSLVREVKAPIAFKCPELHERQRIGVVKKRDDDTRHADDVDLARADRPNRRVDVDLRAAAAVTSSPKISPQALNGLLEVTISEARS